jgi:hypothetical protein
MKLPRCYFSSNRVILRMMAGVGMKNTFWNWGWLAVLLGASFTAQGCGSTEQFALPPDDTRVRAHPTDSSGKPIKIPERKKPTKLFVVAEGKAEFRMFPMGTSALLVEHLRGDRYYKKIGRVMQIHGDHVESVPQFTKGLPSNWHSLWLQDLSGEWPKQAWLHASGWDKNDTHETITHLFSWQSDHWKHQETIENDYFFGLRSLPDNSNVVMTATRSRRTPSVTGMTETWKPEKGRKPAWARRKKPKDGYTIQPSTAKGCPSHVRVEQFFGSPNGRLFALGTICEKDPETVKPAIEIWEPDSKQSKVQLLPNETPTKVMNFSFERQPEPEGWRLHTASANNQVYVAGISSRGGQAAPLLFHFDGNKWSSIKPPQVAQIRAIWASPDGGLWLISYPEPGVVYRRNYKNWWVEVPMPERELRGRSEPFNPLSVWGAAKGDFWVLGEYFPSRTRALMHTKPADKTVSFALAD